MHDKENRIVVSCSPGLAETLALELSSLGFEAVGQEQKAVEIKGTFQDAMLLNYKLRSANKVLWHLASFKAFHPNKLYTQVKRIHWEEWIKADGYFSVDSFVKNRFINDTRFANLRVKDAIADRFMDKSGKRPDSGPGKDGVVIFFRWLEEQVDLFIDTSGHAIAKHGYRRFPGPAPLMENLASALIQSSTWNGRTNFINPMCGSGTLAIEAALMASHVFPGKFRSSYGFMKLLKFDRKSWYRLRDRIAEEKLISTLDFRIIATDISRKAIGIARENARLAGVDHMIDFKVCRFEDTEIPPGSGIVMLNPPLW